MYLYHCSLHSAVTVTHLCCVATSLWLSLIFNTDGPSRNVSHFPAEKRIQASLPPCSTLLCKFGVWSSIPCITNNSCSLSLTSLWPWVTQGWLLGPGTTATRLQLHREEKYGLPHTWHQCMETSWSGWNTVYYPQPLMIGICFPGCLKQSSGVTVALLHFNRQRSAPLKIWLRPCSLMAAEAQRAEAVFMELWL